MQDSSKQEELKRLEQLVARTVDSVHTQLAILFYALDRVANMTEDDETPLSHSAVSDARAFSNDALESLKSIEQLVTEACNGNAV